MREVQLLVSIEGEHLPLLEHGVLVPIVERRGSVDPCVLVDSVTSDAPCSVDLIHGGLRKVVVEAVGLAVEVEGEGRELAVEVFLVIADDEAASHEQVVELEEALAEMPSGDGQQNILSVVVRLLARDQPN